MPKTNPIYRLSRLTVIWLQVVALQAFAQQTDSQEDQAPTGQKEDESELLEVITEEIVVIGSRAKPRSVTKSMVPVDVISSQDFTSQGDADLSNLLRTLAPSYNVSTQPISDASTIVRPLSLRNLAPDHTLVLINGKRRHRAAVIHWGGGGPATGAQGPDLAVIPAIALRQVEVLRDGASAQYGSDAIAGVMNFQLKDARQGGTLEVRTGAYTAGDGESWSAAGNLGLPWGQFGFLNLSGEFATSKPTDRSLQRADAAALISRGNTHIRDPAQIWGSPDIDDDVKLWANFGNVFGSTQFYGHANYAGKKVTGGFFFRNPNTRSGVFSADGGQTLLIGDLLDARDGVLDGSAGCPEVRVVDHVPDPVALKRVFEDPDCFSFQERFPGGFTPQFGGETLDASLVGGFRGQTGNAINWDVSLGAGSNEADFFIFNTVNASLGPDSPTDFDPGKYTQRELNFNVDLSYALSRKTNLAGGFEWRNEQFEIGMGQLESFRIGPLAPQGFSATSNGFPGFSAIAAGKWNRSNYAVYGDLEFQGDDDAWTAGGALRFEDFEGFGGTLNGKVAARLRLVEDFSLRSSLSTGFRAPTPGQSNAFNVSTQFDLALMDLVNNGTIPSTSAVARLRGGNPLEPETSRNFALGGILERGPFTLTADLFRIDVDDRLTLTQLFSLRPEEVEDLVAEGVTSASNLQNFRFFTNDFSTRTAGLDVIATWTPPRLGGHTDFSFLLNHTDTKVTDFNPDTLSQRRLRSLEEDLPETRYSFTLKHEALEEKLRLLGRFSYYSSWFDFDNSHTSAGRHLLDLELAYSFKRNITLAIGGQNVFNTYPDENPIALNVGERYSESSPFGFNGAYYYARLSYSFGSAFK